LTESGERGEGPWLLDKIMIIKPYDGLSSAESIDLTKFAAWIQIHKLPIRYRDHDLIKNPTKKKMGKVFSMETEF
jgi:hypothetical protein